MLPYSLILCMFWILYSLIFSAVIIRPNTIYNPFDAVLALFHVLQSSFFQMFGEFQAEDFIDHFGEPCLYACYGNRRVIIFTTKKGSICRHILPVMANLWNSSTHVLLYCKIGSKKAPEIALYFPLSTNVRHSLVYYRSSRMHKRHITRLHLSRIRSSHSTSNGNFHTHHPRSAHQPTDCHFHVSCHANSTLSIGTTHSPDGIECSAVRLGRLCAFYLHPSQILFHY